MRRCKDKDLNVLTVVANTSYDEFSKNLQKSYNEESGFNKEQVSADIVSKIFKQSGIKPEDIDSELSSVFLKELKENGIINSKGELNKDIDEKLEKLEFKNETLNNHSIKLKEEIINSMEEKGSKRIIVENGDEDNIPNERSSFVIEEDFKEIVFDLGDRLSYKTNYRVNIDEEKFISNAIKNVNEYFKNKDLVEQFYSIEEGMHFIDNFKGAQYKDAVKVEEKLEDYEIKISRSKFEVVDYIMEGTDLPRLSIGKIYDGLEKKHIFNSQEYLDGALKEIKSTLLNSISENSIEYDLLEGYSMDNTTIFEMDTVINTELGNDKTYIYPKDPLNDRTKRGLNRYYKFDSKGEEGFAQQLDRDDRVKLFTKLKKGGFVIDTPYGNYTPDWAIVYEDEEGIDMLYFVCETKFEKEWKDLNDEEQFKIKCGEAHFETISKSTGKGIKFDWANSYRDFKDKNKLY